MKGSNQKRTATEERTRKLLGATIVQQSRLTEPDEVRVYEAHDQAMADDWSDDDERGRR